MVTWVNDSRLREFILVFGVEYHGYLENSLCDPGRQSGLWVQKEEVDVSSLSVVSSNCLLD